MRSISFPSFFIYFSHHKIIYRRCIETNCKEEEGRRQNRKIGNREKERTYERKRERERERERGRTTFLPLSFFISVHFLLVLREQHRMSFEIRHVFQYLRYIISQLMKLLHTHFKRTNSSIVKDGSHENTWSEYAGHGSGRDGDVYTPSERL